MMAGGHTGHTGHAGQAGHRGERVNMSACERGSALLSAAGGVIDATAINSHSGVTRLDEHKCWGMH